MTSARPYRAAGSAADALAECARESGAQFAPWAVEALMGLWREGGLQPAPAQEAPTARR